MRTPTVLILTVLLSSLPALLVEAVCCSVKLVTATGSGMDGKYTFMEEASAAAKDPMCFDGCIYSRDGRAGEEYCFQAVDGGATIEDQCAAPSQGATDGMTPPMITTGRPARRPLERSQRSRGM